MYLFVLYAAIIWLGAYAFRRRWPAFFILVASVPIALVTVRLLNYYLDVHSIIFYLAASAYEVLIVGVGIVIALAPRASRPAFQCHRCRYDLAGNESGVCPECGVVLDRPTARSEHKKASAHYAAR